MKKKPQKHVVNCDMCGRDTVNKSRICYGCTGGINPAFESEKTKELRELWEALYGDVMTRDEEVDKEVRDSIELD